MLYLLETLEHQLHKLYAQGKKWSEVQLLKVMLFGVNAGRKTYLGLVSLMFFAMVLALSFCSTLLLAAFQMDEFGRLYWTWPLGTSVILFAISSLIFLVTSREGTWLRASGVKRRLRELYGPYHDREAVRQGLPAEPAMDRAEMQYELRRSVDEVVQRRMREEFDGLRTELRSVLREKDLPAESAESAQRTARPAEVHAEVRRETSTSYASDTPASAAKKKEGIDIEVPVKTKQTPPSIH